MRDIDDVELDSRNGQSAQDGDQNGKWEAYDRYQGLGCGAACFRKILICTNMLVLLLSIILLGYGATMVVTILHDLFGSVGLTLLIVSLTMALVSALGFFGAKKESVCVLFIYCMIVALLNLCLVVLCIFMAINRGNEAELIEEFWSVLDTQMIDTIALAFSCCPKDEKCDSPNSISNSNSSSSGTTGGEEQVVAICQDVIGQTYNSNLQGIVITVSIVICTLFITSWSTIYLIRAIKNVGAQFTSLNSVPNSA